MISANNPGRWQTWLSRKFRGGVYIKRYLRAAADHFAGCHPSYSQNQEDVEIERQLQGIDLRDAVYVDVGANQPTHLSNTYRFYRQGRRGILVEPDESNVALLKRFRPRDVVVRSLAGSDSRLCKFNYSIYSVCNSVHEVPEHELLRTDYIPQLTLDQIVDCVSGSWIFLLSIDTEGHDLEVLKGAVESLKRTLLVCVEFHGEAEKSALVDFLGDHGFRVSFSGELNMIFRNSLLEAPRFQTRALAAMSEGLAAAAK